MTHIARFAAVAFAALACAASAFADPYKVRDLSVDETAASAKDAQTIGWAKARQAAAERLINRLTLQEDRNAARQPIDPSAVARLYTGTDLQVSEKRTGTRYIATLIVNFDAKTVRDYLDSRGVPFVDSQAGLTLVEPMAGPGVNPVDWASHWKGKADDTRLTPWTASVEAWDKMPGWTDVQEEATRVAANRVVVAEVYNQGGYVVRLTDLRTGAPPPVTAGPYPDLASAQAGAIDAMETAWKQQSIVRTSGSNTMSLAAYFKDVGQWVKIRKGVESSRLVSGLKIESISTVGADLSFSYAGRPDQLAADLRARGLDLRTADRGYTLEILGGQ